MQCYDTIIIGSGCAGYNAADWLYDLGHRNIAILTEGINSGTSRNTGSDKQTYYKLSLSGRDGDSIGELAQSFFSGGGMHGDHALIEAACGVKSFMKLVQLGVPFPCNEYGEYVGYKTDHDLRRRATSSGPYTSKYMTEALERAVVSKHIPIHDHRQAVRLIVHDNQVEGVVCIDPRDDSQCMYGCKQIILATGGPAGAYAHSVYPTSQTGGTGLALMAGAAAQNLCEWQYGLASVKFRWNVSGSYQQALPRYVAVSPDGAQREFLHESLGDQVNDMVFLKGYQWPFDVRKIDGSSRVDMLVHREICAGNRVYMDFRYNATGTDLHRLGPEALEYLTNSQALLETPIERLEKLNPQAIALYLSHGIDIRNEPLEVAVCAQHCNGGLGVDEHWQTNIGGLYAVGEAAGVFGVYRPGGSALNDAQVGSMRAAEHIARTGRRCCAPPCESGLYEPRKGSVPYAQALAAARAGMSRHAAFLRDIDQLKSLQRQIGNLFSELALPEGGSLAEYAKAEDTLLTQLCMISAMIVAAETFGSRGSALCGAAKAQGMDKVVITRNMRSLIEPVRPLPEGGGWFEAVWQQYQNRMVRL